MGAVGGGLSEGFIESDVSLKILDAYSAAEKFFWVKLSCEASNFFKLTLVVLSKATVETLALARKAGMLEAER